MDAVKNRNNRVSKAHCGVPQCNNYKSDNVSMHSIPREDLANKNELRRWMIALKMGKPFPKYFLICSEHFKTDELLCPVSRLNVNKKVGLKKGAFPSKNLPTSSILPKLQGDKGKERLDRLKSRQNFACVETPVESENCDVCVPHDEEDIMGTNPISIAVQCSIRMKDKKVQANLENTVFVTSLWDTDTKLNTKTGIPTLAILNTMVAVCKIIRPYENCTMSLRNRILLTMFRLKSNCSFAEVTIDFQISHKSAKHYFVDTIQLLAKAMKSTIHWQTREENVKSLPYYFKNFQNVMTVLDCTEIKTITFSCLKCRTSTYSHYKGGHTLKVLIGVAPSGLINFISPFVAGKTSDKAIFNLTNLIEKLKPDDAVMVDKGFMIGNELLNAGIEMIRPDFLYYIQSKSEVRRNTQIASARVHVERRIARLKIFGILSNKVALSVLPYIDDIMTVICAISNLDTPILKDDKFM